MTSGSKMATAFAKHNHRACSGGVMKTADRMASEAGLRLTPVRRRTLQILLEEHRALGAYEVLDRLAQDGYGRQPPVAYRALEFLVENGLAHRIRRLNAFAACMQPGKRHAPAFFICSRCDVVAEVPEPAVSEALRGAASRVGFQIERMNIEALGTCPACQRRGAA
jgi:Fur family transcriptional regulator, zinc uptake regulator